MKKFIQDNLFQVIISFLLLIIVSMGAYFIHKVESLENRLWEVEMKNPSLQTQIRALDRKVDRMEKNLSDKIDIQYDALKDLILERSP